MHTQFDGPEAHFIVIEFYCSVENLKKTHTHKTYSFLLLFALHWAFFRQFSNNNVVNHK